MIRETEDATRTPKILLVGHPHAPIGMGAHLRGISRALRAANVPHAVHDVYKGEKIRTAEHEEFAGLLTEEFDDPIRIFASNGDEINPIRRIIEARNAYAFRGGYNILYPLSELPRYPGVWGTEV